MRKLEYIARDFKSAVLFSALGFGLSFFAKIYIEDPVVRFFPQVFGECTVFYNFFRACYLTNEKYREF